MNIIGKTEATASQMAQYLINKNASAKSWALEYAQIYIEEAEAEGVRGDGAWAQSCIETGNFTFSGSAVTFSQNNFCGMGVTSNGMTGNSFSTPRLGIRAQIQHLKGYAAATPLVNACVDPRYAYISPKGKAPTFEELAGNWAVPGYDTSQASSLADAMSKKIGYGFNIISIVNQIKLITTSSNEEGNSVANPIIALSAGHGLYTSGKRCLKSIDPNETREWYLNDRIVDKVETKLKAYNCTVIRVNDTTGTVDTPLATRVTTANNAGANIYISTHHNAGINGGSGGGTVVFYYPSGTNKTVATSLYNHIVSCTGLKGNRSTPVSSTTALYEVTAPKMTAFLIENGFMDSTYDTPIILTEDHAEKTATGIVAFLAEYLSLQKNGTVVSTTSTTTTTSSSTSASTARTYSVGQVVTYSSCYKSSTDGTDKAISCSPYKTGTITKVLTTNVNNPYLIGNGTCWVNDGDIRSVVGSGTTSTSSATTTTTTSTASSTGKYTYGGVEYSLVFDPTYYANKYADLKAAFGTNATNLFNHFTTYGMKEGRQAISTFNVTVYKNTYADLRSAFGDNLPNYYKHYIQYGYKEGRKCV